VRVKTEQVDHLVAEVDLCPVVFAFLDQVDEPEVTFGIGASGSERLSAVTW